MPDETKGRHAILVGLLASVACLLYFFALDRFAFSTRNFAAIYRVLLTEYDVRTAALAFVVCVLAASWRNPAPALKIVDGIARHPRVIVPLTVIVFSICSVVVYHNYPLCMDEYAAVFQAKIFAARRLYADLPPSVVNWLIVPGFNGSFLYASRETGRAIEGYWPGFALLLAPFELLGIPWLCNPALAGLSLYLIFRITFSITGDRGAAAWAMVFAVASGAFCAYAISYYSMQAHLTANLSFAFLLMKPTWARSFAAGVVGSLALVLHNPFPHALFAVPWLMSFARDGSRRHYLIAVAAGYLPGLICAAGWLVLRTELVSVAHTLSAVSGVASGVFTWPDRALLDMRVASIIKLWIWASPCLLLFVFLGWRSRRTDQYVRLLTQSAALTFLGYCFVRLDQGHGWGYRYFHSAWGVLPILAGCAMTDRSASALRIVSFAGATAMLGLILVVPFQMEQINELIMRHLSQLPPPKRPGNNVYFIKPGGGFYMADLIQTDPFLRSQDLFLASRGTELDEELVQQNWPDAVRLSEGRWAMQWYLGPVDLRRSTNTASEDERMRLTFAKEIKPR